MSISDKFRERIETVLGALEKKPKPLKAFLLHDYPGIEPVAESDLEALLNCMLDQNPNEPLSRRFGGILRSWDNVRADQWHSPTRPNSANRRAEIYQMLQLDNDTSGRVDLVFPRCAVEDPIIVSKKHEKWYNREKSGRNFYWAAYSNYLKTIRNWNDESITSLDTATTEIVSRLANPESEAAYGARGLVVGYVQSGKTANFTGVIAKAADAGYRLIIVLAGTWNMLRAQTQRRIDKELLGQELLENKQDYDNPVPEDWEDFISHDGLPSRLGAFDWERLTSVHEDFSDLGAALGALEFRQIDKNSRLNAPHNLHQLPARLIVIKKNPARLSKLVENLGAINTRVGNLPTLIIDDESDQAGLNTIRPNALTPETERTRTNETVVHLLGLLPRAQYIGYTATPYANALVDPNDPEDLFPKDFIVLLRKPLGYMGISDFFDPELDSDDLTEGDYHQNENAFVRTGGEDVEGALEQAVASFILAGAIKLLRQEEDPVKYRFEHHTMLVHTGFSKDQHAADRDRLLAILANQAFSSPKGMAVLRGLWEKDYKPVSIAQSKNDICPRDFDALRSSIGECLNRLNDGVDVWVLNSDSDKAPDFNHEEIWAIFVGGNKLSRGYTIEGLTISYFTRPARQADTLMQMGRWFGFRKGYRDLVRIFIGRSEGRDSVDLVDWFKQACLLEERFRADVERYSENQDEPLRPIDIPPLIEVTGDLMPTAKNKMWNAVLESKNFGDHTSTPTLAPVGDSIARNDRLARDLWEKLAKKQGPLDLGGGDVLINAVFGLAETAHITSFLDEYNWLDDKQPTEVRLLIEFLSKADHGIRDFAVIAPQRAVSFGEPWHNQLSVKKRTRLKGNRGNEVRGFKVIGESKHRTLARTIAMQGEGSGPKIAAPNDATLKLKRKGRAVLLFYPIREQADSKVSIGFEIIIPPNDLPPGLQYTTRVADEVATIETGNS